MSRHSFNNAVRPVFVAFQLIWTFPVYGVLGGEPIALRFRWISIRTFLSLVLTLYGVVMCRIEYERLERVGVNTGNIIGIVFFADTVIIMFLLVNLSRRWRSLAILWDKFDRAYPNIADEKKKRTLHSTIWIISFVLMLCAVIEHLLSKGAGMIDQYKEAQFCHWEVDDFSRYFANRNYSYIFNHVPYNILILLFLEYLNNSLTMAWTCQDLIIVLVSIGLTFYFKQVYAKIQHFSSGIMIADERFWTDIRSQYVLLCELVNVANDLLAPLVISSCSTNLYLICFQLVNVTNQDESWAAILNHWYALTFLISKTVLVFYTAAMINEAAKAPLAICTSIPTTGWCLELERFQHLLRTESVALSGWGFFHITKRTILAMAGIVVTYELVMLRLAQNTKGMGAVEPCSKLAYSRDD